MKITGNTNLPAAAEAALNEGNKIRAIRIVRESMNIGLAQAKAVVEAAETNSPMPAARARAAQHDGLSPGEAPRSNGAAQAAFFVIAIIVAIAAYIKFG